MMVYTEATVTYDTKNTDLKAGFVDVSTYERAVIKSPIPKYASTDREFGLVRRV